MSLENQLENLNANLEKGISLLEQLVALGGTGGEKPIEMPDKKPAAEKKAPAKKKAAPKEKEKPVDEFPDYEGEVKPLILGYAKDNKQDIIDVLSRYSVKNAKALEAGQYQEFMDRLTNAVENGIETDTDFMAERSGEA